MFNKVYEVRGYKNRDYSSAVTIEVPLSAKVTTHYSKGKPTHTSIVALKTVPADELKAAVDELRKHTAVTTNILKTTFYLGYLDGKFYSLHSFHPYGDA